MKNHNGRDHNSHLFKHSVEKGKDRVLKNDFKILGKGYNNNTSWRKIAVPLPIMKLIPSFYVN